MHVLSLCLIYLIYLSQYIKGMTNVVVFMCIFSILHVDINTCNRSQRKQFYYNNNAKWQISGTGVLVHIMTYRTPAKWSHMLNILRTTTNINELIIKCNNVIIECGILKQCYNWMWYTKFIKMLTVVTM